MHFFLPFFLGGVGGEGKEEFVTESIPLLGSLTQKQPIFQRKKHWFWLNVYYIETIKA